MKITEVFSRGTEVISVLEKTHSRAMAITYLLTSNFIMTIMYLCVNVLRHDYTPIQIVNFRLVFGLIINTIICSQQKVSIYTDNKPLFKLLVWRGLLGGLGMLTVFMCISNMKLSDGVVIVNTNPIWTNLLAACFLGEHFKKSRLVFCLISFVGIMIVSRPTFLFGESGTSTDKNYNEFLGICFGIIGSFFVSIVSIFMRKLSHDFKCPGSVQMQHTFFISALTTATILPFTQTESTTITLKIVLYMSVLSICGVLGQLFLARAMSLEKASILAPLQYSQVIFSFLADLFILKVDILMSSVIGVSLIVFGSIGVIV